jgi:hypothetical protein
MEENNTIADKKLKDLCSLMKAKGLYRILDIQSAI